MIVNSSAVSCLLMESHASACGLIHGSCASADKLSR